ncbi:MAG: methylenetetrahydrofolate reductase C-terminal domain-containing protein [Coriobacteriia bacterium]|nr:methylenetetrahydrofolate reductase C-terminal domain-containing protein [Coriobacteriia bacterium]MCL2750710.1 methylenetetrahydrofolate reductase C-terminal domain-containing protein [Coriobacteriia bacterium]
MANKLKEVLDSGEFAVTVEMIPGRGAREDAQIHEHEAMEQIYATGRVHAISITDNPGGNPAILADQIARDFAKSNICSLVHFTCKDRSRNQMQAQLYALDREGLDNVLMMSGDYQISGFMGRARPVFDLDPVQALMLASEMNKGLIVEGPRGSSQEKPSSFFPGAVVNPFKYTEGEAIPQYLKLERKILAGAQFIITQLGYDARKMEELIMYTRERGYNVPLIANVFLLTRGAAKLMQKGAIAGCYISDELMEKLEEEFLAEDKGKAARIERAAVITAIAKGLGYAGVHIGGFGLDAAMVTKILDRAEELAGEWRQLVPLLSFGDDKGYFIYEAKRDAEGNPTGLNASTKAPGKEAPKKRKIYKRYRLSRFFHHMVLTKDKAFYGILAGSMDRRDKKKGLNRHHALEHTGKAFLYGCIDCGDCGLEACVYTCPMSQCPKCQRNGPCGGSNPGGWCEVYPNERYCIHYMAYYRLRKYNELQKMSSYTTPPNNWDYFETSGWSNYTHERDNAANRIPLSIGLDAPKAQSLSSDSESA